MPDATLALTMPLAGVSPRESLEIARRARDWGYRAAWGSEVQGPDAFTILGAVAATTDLDLGVAVLPVQTRTAVVLAMSAITMAELTGGRFALGVGSSSELIVAQWAGQPFDAPYTHVRETVEALRPLLSGERTTYEGRYVRVGGYRPHATPPAPVPLYVGALGPRMLRLAGELGDGVCFNQLAPRHVPGMLAEVRAGATNAGRELPEGFGVVARLFCAVTDQVEMARAAVKHVFGPYVATSVYNAYYRRLGYEKEAEAVAEAAKRHDRAAMAEAMSDALVEDIFVVGDADAVASRVKEYVAAGVTVPVIAPLAAEAAGAEATLRAIVERW